MSSEKEQTSRYWSDLAVSGNTGSQWWDAGPEILFRINRNISGDPNCDYTTYTLNKYYHKVLPAARCLSLGCGTGLLERSLARQGAFQNCDAYDIAEGSVQKAKELADEEGYGNINYFVADINNIALPPDTYDMVWIQGALHHFQALEHVCEQISQSLKPSGLLILNEYVGPNRFQFPSRQKEVANLCLQLLPKKYRLVTRPASVENLPAQDVTDNSKGIGWYASRVVDKLRDGDLLNTARRRTQAYRYHLLGKDNIKSIVSFPTPRDLARLEPSEAIRSEEIIPVVKQYFEIVEFKELGGNIIQFLLMGIAHNFSRDDAQSQAFLRMLINIEETLIASGEFRSDFVYLVARPLET